jgi:hypothetical protein
MNIVICPSGLVVNLNYLVMITDNDVAHDGKYVLTVTTSAVVITATDKEFIEARIIEAAASV